MSNIPLIDSSSGRLVGTGLVDGLESGPFGIVLSRRSVGISPGSPVGAGLRLGSGYRLRSSSRRRLMISSGSGNPSGPVLCVPDVGTPSPPGKVGAVVPLGGGFLITSIVGNDGEACSDCSRAKRSVV